MDVIARELICTEREYCRHMALTIQVLSIYFYKRRYSVQKDLIKIIFRPFVARKVEKLMKVKLTGTAYSQI